MSALTKIFIVLQLVFSLVLSVMVIQTLSTQQKYKDQIEGMAKQALASQVSLAKTSAEVAARDAEIGKLQASLRSTAGEWASKLDAANSQAAEATKRINDLMVTLASAEATNKQNAATVESLKNQLADANKARGDLLPENLRLMQRYAEVARQNNELSQQVRAAEQAIKRLKEQVALLEEQSSTNKAAAAAPAAGSGSVPTMASGIQTASAINGKIARVAVNNGRTYITMPLGTRDGVRENTQFTIYRGNEYIGDAIVRKSAVDESVAVVTTVKQGVTVQNGDMVMSGQ